MGARLLRFRTIDLATDRAMVIANYHDTHRESFGDEKLCNDKHYLPWLAARIEEFPDGHVLAFNGTRCVGQLELQVPWGATAGYVNLYCVRRTCRGQGFGRLLHEYAENYFRSWEAELIELHVSSTNTRATGFYRHMGYRLARIEGRLWRMDRRIAQSARK